MSTPARTQEQLAANRRAYGACVALVVGVLAAAGLVLSLLLGLGPIGLGFGLGVAVLVVGFAPGLGERAALAAVGAEAAAEDRWPRYRNLVEGLCADAGLPVPTLYVARSDAANALSVGRRPGAAALVVTTGLLATLNRVELEGVLAHELAHIQTEGARLATIGVALAPLRRLALPRRRELEADEGGARLTRYPPGLVSALRKLDPAARPPGGAAVRDLWIVPPDDPAGPSVADRIAALGEL